MRKSPYLLLIVATCLWGGNYVAGKAIVPHIPPLLLATLRWTLALVVVIPLWGKELVRHRAALLRHWKMVLFLSLTGVAGFNTLLYIAVQYTGSINASLMNAATPIIVVFFSAFLLGERIVWSAMPAIALSMLGVLWIISRGSWTVMAGLSFNSGDLWAVGAVVCWGLYSVGMKKIAGVLPVHALFTAKIIVTLLLLIPLSCIEWAVRQPSLHFTPQLYAGILYIALFASIVAFTAWNAAIAALGPSRCSGFLNLIPIFSAVFATLFAGESIRSYHLIGAVLIVGGVFWMNRLLRQSRSAAAHSVQT